MTNWQAAVARLFEQLLALKQELKATDAQIAAAVGALLQAREDAPELASEPRARDALLRAVWLLFVATPRLSPRSLALVPMQLQLLEAGQGQVEELIDYVWMSVTAGGDEDARELAQLLGLSGDALEKAVHGALEKMRDEDLDGRIAAVAKDLVADLVQHLPLLGNEGEAEAGGPEAGPRSSSPPLQRSQRSPRAAEAAPDAPVVSRLLAAMPEETRRALGASFEEAHRHTLRGDRRGAIEAYGRAIEVAPSYFEGYLLRGSLRREEGLDREALADLDEAVRLCPESSAARLGRAHARAAAGDLQGAAEDYDEAIRLAPVAAHHTARGYFRLSTGLVEPGIDDFSQAIRLDPDDTMAWYNRANARMQRGDHEGAIADYTAVLDRDPRDAQALFNRATARASLEDAAGAIGDLDQAIAIDRAYALAYAKRATLRWALDEPGPAYADALAGLALAPKGWVYADALGELLGELEGTLAERPGEIAGPLTERVAQLDEAGAGDAALRLLQAAARRIPALREHLHYAQALMLLREGKQDKALKALDRAIAADETLADAWFQKGAVLLDKDDAEGAIAALDRALALHREGSAGIPLARVHLLRGRALGDLGQVEEGLDALDKATDLDPGSAEAWFFKGFYRDLAGDRTGAIRAYDEAIVRDPSFATAYFNRACEHALLGHKAEALADLERASELDPDRAREATEDTYFEAFWDDPDFQALVERYLDEDEEGEEGDEDEGDEDEGDEDEGESDEEGDEDEGDEDDLDLDEDDLDEDEDEEEGVDTLSEDAILVILPPGAREQDVSRAAAEARLWWKDLRNATPRQHLMVEWVTPDNRTLVTYVYDSALDIRFLTFQGGEPAPVASRMREALGGETEEGALERLRTLRDREALVEGLARVGLIASMRPTLAIDEVVRAALEHPEAEVRHAALVYPPPGSLDDLEEIIQGLSLSDPDRRVRVAAARYLGQDPEPFELKADLDVTEPLVAARPVARREVIRFAWDAGWLVDSISPASMDQALELIWVTGDARHAVHYLEDELWGTQVVLVRGAEGEGLVADLVKRFGLLDTEAGLARAAAAAGGPDATQALQKLAPLLPDEVDARFVEALGRFVANADAEVRLLAVQAMSLRPWAELAPFVAALQADPEARVRRSAALLLRHYAEQGAIESAEAVKPAAVAAPAAATASAAAGGAPIKLAVPSTLGLPQLSQQAAQLGWAWTGVEKDEEGEYGSVSWSTAEGTTATVRVGLTAVLCFEGPGAAAAAAQARGAMALRDRGELLAQLGGGLGGEARQEAEALLALSAVAPATHDEEIAAALVAATKHPEPSVRWEALRAAGSTGWRELLPRIEEMATDDPDAHIRKLAGGIAELMEG